MHLIIFDIDGTLVDSVKTDDECFIQTFQELHEIVLKDVDWSTFPHVTDSGLSKVIFQQYLKREPSEDELIAFKTHFLRLIEQRKAELIEVEGARKTIEYLMELPDISIAFATGGWKETAQLKLKQIGVFPSDLVFISANDHYDRAVITKMAITQSQAKEQLEHFETITYIGDGLWDFDTSQQLGIQFIGIDAHQSQRLKQAGAFQVLDSLADVQQLISWVKNTS